MVLQSKHKTRPGTSALLSRRSDIVSPVCFHKPENVSLKRVVMYIDSIQSYLVVIRC